MKWQILYFELLYLIFYLDLERFRLCLFTPIQITEGHFEGNRPLLSVGDLKLVREILVKEFPSFANRRETHSGNVVVDSILPVLKGEDWKRVRSIVSPTFTTGKIRR
ncbi:cytochrome P450 3A11, partial [Trichonephila inaurata madagascariensis]